MIVYLTNADLMDNVYIILGIIAVLAVRYMESIPAEGNNDKV